MGAQGTNPGNGCPMCREVPPSVGKWQRKVRDNSSLKNKGRRDAGVSCLGCRDVECGDGFPVL